MVTVSAITPTPEYCAFKAMIETGFIPDDYNQTARWNDKDSQFHKFWNLFIEKLDSEAKSMVVSKYYKADSIEGGGK